jgi:hypothetical protein
VFGENDPNKYIGYRPSQYGNSVNGHAVFKDGKKYFGIEYVVGQRTSNIDVQDFKPNAERQYLSVDITGSNIPGPFEYNGQYVYEVQLFMEFMDDPIPPTIYHI